MISLETPTQVQERERMTKVRKESKKLTRSFPDSFYLSFKKLFSKFLFNSALYYGRSAVKELFQSNSKVISAPCMAPLNELKAFVQNNTRIPYLFSYNKNINQSDIDIINEAMINSYSANNINKAIIDAWIDFMINGIGVLKFVADFENMIHAEVIQPNGVIFDYSNIEQPQFFICEKIISTEQACKEYSIDQEEFAGILGNPSEPKILQSSKSWDVTLARWFSEKEEGKTYKKNIQDIYSKDFTNKVVYEQPAVGFNVIREEYKRTYAKDEDDNKKLFEMYQRNVYLNNHLVSSNDIKADNFPFIIMHNYKRDTTNSEEAFPCFLDQVRADILLYNNLYCLQLDGLTKSAAGSSLIIMKPDSIEDGANKSNKSSANLNLIKVKPDIDQSINDVVTKTSPIDLSQSIQAEMQLCLSRMRACTGLMDFETPMKSGYQESLRLDREMANVSYWITNVDDAITKVGKLMKNIIGTFLANEADVVKKFLSDPEVLNAESCKTLRNIIKQSVHGVKENKDAFTFKSKIINDLITLRDLTGEAITIDVKSLASNLRMPQEVIDTIDNNTPDVERINIEKQAIVSEIEKTKTDSIKNVAMANKYNAEAKSEEKESKKPITKTTSKNK